LPPSGQYGNFSDSAGPVMLYGAIVDQQLKARSDAAKLCKARKRINCVSVLLALLGPWAIFVLVFGVVSFYPHYAAPLTVSLAATVLLILGIRQAADGVKAWRIGDEDRAIRLYLGVALVVAIALGWTMGDINFWQFMQPCYHVDHLATYSNVNPSSQHLWSGEQVPVRGRRYQDAGKVYFSDKARLDLTRAASFKDGRVFCVAPIIDPGCKKNCGYDFWAVGIDCCSEFAPDFKCGNYNSTRAKSGLRQIVDSWRPFFRLAVLQAEGMHHVSSRHPLFFTWVDDPVAELRTWKLAGYRRFIVAMIFSFAMNAVLVVPVLRSALALAK